MARKLTPSVVRRIRKLHEQGRNRAEIAAEVNVSTGSVSNALKQTSTPAQLEPPAPPAPDVEPGAVPTPVELRRWLGDSIRAAMPRARGGDLAAARLVAMMGALLARVTPKNDGEPDGVFVTTAAMEDAAEHTRAQLHRMLGRALDQQAELPKCHACGAPVAERGAP